MDCGCGCSAANAVAPGGAGTPRRSGAAIAICTATGTGMSCFTSPFQGRFGGHTRLDYGYGHPFPPLHRFDKRPHSVKLYMPSRTAQVLCRESLLEGGIKVCVENSFLSQYDVKNTEGMKLSLVVNKDGLEEMLDFPFENGVVHLPDNWDATFDIVTGDDMILPCKCSKDTKIRIYFPGDCTIALLGYLRNGKPENAPPSPKKPKAAAKGYSKPVQPAAEPEPQAEPPMVASPPVASPVGSPVAAPAPSTVKVKEEAKAEEAGVDVRDMTRCYSGLHFMNTDDLDQALRDTTHEVSEVEQTKMRMANFQENLAACGGDLVQISESYKSFGLQKNGATWTYCEWMPCAKEVYLVGDFNDWVTSATPLLQESPDSFPDVWSATLPATTNLKSGSKYKLFIVPEEGDPYYAMSAWATRFIGPNEMKFLDVASMIYLDRGRWVPVPSELEEYFATDENTEKAGLQYLMQANTLIHQLEPNAKTIAEDEWTLRDCCGAAALRETPSASGDNGPSVWGGLELLL